MGLFLKLIIIEPYQWSIQLEQTWKSDDKI